MNQPWYPQVFIGAIVAFVMGLLMAYFCYEVLNEEFEAIEYNQSHVDSEQKKFGIRYEFWVSCHNYLGDDWHFWLIPTHPVLRTNLFERTWSRRDLKNQDVLKEEDDSDPDRKMLSIE